MISKNRFPERNQLPSSLIPTTHNFFWRHNVLSCRCVWFSKVMTSNLESCSRRLLTQEYRLLWRSILLRCRTRNPCKRPASASKWYWTPVMRPSQPGLPLFHIRPSPPLEMQQWWRTNVTTLISADSYYFKRNKRAFALRTKYWNFRRGAALFAEKEDTSRI